MNDSIAEGENTYGAERLKHSKMAPEVLRTYFFRFLTNELRSVGVKVIGNGYPFAGRVSITKSPLLLGEEEQLPFR